MCGIVGIIYRDPDRPVAQEVVERMCSAIAHRGPDDQGIMIKGSVGLGMRRLSIIDLEGSNQPVFNEDHTRAIIFNGEIYNYRVLREELLNQGHVFRTNGDTETIVHLSEQFGPECVNRLRGMFAFAVWDESKRSLLLARDRFGIKPLYYTVTDDGIAFASELKALLAVDLVSRELDWRALDIFFQLGYIPAPYSPFKDVRKLPPGHFLRWNESGEVRVERYWNLPAEPADLGVDPRERVLQLLDDSVKAHLVSDVPVAAFLSGGFDSSAVVSSMALQGYPVHAYTARYHGTGAETTDETGLASQLAERYGIRHTVVDVHPNAIDIFEKMVYHLDEPLADESGIPTWLISEAVSSSYKVVLAGTGGDELFAGYRRHMGMLLGSRYMRLPGGLRRLIKRAISKVPEPSGGSLTIDRLKRFVRTTDASTEVEQLIGYISRLQLEERTSLYASDLRSVVADDSARNHFQDQLGQGPGFAGLKGALALDYAAYLPDDLLALSDRISMAHSLEVRVPLVDHVMVDELFAMSDRTRVGFGSAKKLFKDALRTRLPAAHYRAPKRGFVGPTATWLRNELRPMLEDELSVARIDRLGMFDSKVVQRLVKEHLARDHNREGILWALLSFQSWFHKAVEP